MNDFQPFPVAGSLRFTADFTDAIPSTSPETTLSSVAWSITPQSGSPLIPSLSDQSDALSLYQSTIQVSGCVHGGYYVLQAVGTTSAGELIPKDVRLVGFDG